MIQEMDFIRYLAAKKSVDDRAINSHVWETAIQALSAQGQAPLRILEVGAGIGTMIERLLERGGLRRVEYTALDEQPENIAHARQRLPVWAKAHGFHVQQEVDGALTISRDDIRFRVCFHHAEALEFARQSAGQYDGLIAHAFLDLFDIPTALAALLPALKPEGLVYFSINFDGVTILEPAVDPELEDQILALYHRSMDERQIRGRISGDSRAGRRLFAHLRQAGVQVLDAGASDWVVFPGAQGYPEDEGYFLHFIINTIFQALHAHPELPGERFERWAARRHAQIERGELVYIAHQLDLCGRLEKKLVSA